MRKRTALSRSIPALSLCENIPNLRILLSLLVAGRPAGCCRRPSRTRRPRTPRPCKSFCRPVSRQVVGTRAGAMQNGAGQGLSGRPLLLRLFLARPAAQGGLDLRDDARRGRRQRGRGRRGGGDEPGVDEGRRHGRRHDRRGGDHVAHLWAQRAGGQRPATSASPARAAAGFAWPRPVRRAASNRRCPSPSTPPATASTSFIARPGR